MYVFVPQMHCERYPKGLNSLSTAIFTSPESKQQHRAPQPDQHLEQQPPLADDDAAVSATCELFSNPLIPPSNVSWKIVDGRGVVVSVLGEGLYSIFPPNTIETTVHLNRSFIRRVIGSHHLSQKSSGSPDDYNLVLDIASPFGNVSTSITTDPNHSVPSGLQHDGLSGKGGSGTEPIGRMLQPSKTDIGILEVTILSIILALLVLVAVVIIVLYKRGVIMRPEDEDPMGQSLGMTATAFQGGTLIPRNGVGFSQDAYQTITRGGGGRAVGTPGTNIWHFYVPPDASLSSNLDSSLVCSESGRSTLLPIPVTSVAYPLSAYSKGSHVHVHADNGHGVGHGVGHPHLDPSHPGHGHLDAQHPGHAHLDAQHANLQGIAATVPAATTASLCGANQEMWPPLIEAPFGGGSEEQQPVYTEAPARSNLV